MLIRFIVLFWILSIASAVRVAASSPLNLGQPHNLQNASVSSQTSNNKDVSLINYLQSKDRSKDIHSHISRKDVLANRADVPDLVKQKLESQTKLDIYRSYASDDNLSSKNITRKKTSSLSGNKHTSRYSAIRNQTYSNITDTSSLKANEKVNNTASANTLSNDELAFINLLYQNNYSRYKNNKNKSDNEVTNVSSLDQKKEPSKTTFQDSVARILSDIERPLVSSVGSNDSYKENKNIQNTSYAGAAIVSSLHQKKDLNKDSSDARILSDIVLKNVSTVDQNNSSKIHKDIPNTSYDDATIVSSLHQKKDLSKDIPSKIKIPLVSYLDSNIAAKKFSDIKSSKDDVCSLEENEELGKINGDDNDSQWRSDAESNLISSLGLQNVTRINRDVEKTSDDDLVISKSSEEKNNYGQSVTVGEYNNVQFPVEFDPKNDLDLQNAPRKYGDTRNISHNDLGMVRHFEATRKSNNTTIDLAVLSDLSVQNTSDLKSNKELHNNSTKDINTQLQSALAITNPSSVNTVSRRDRNADSPSDYEYIPGLGYYKLHEQAETWNDARRICLAEEAHLVVIDSLEEAKTISHLQEDTIVFVGIHDLFVTRQYVTLFDVPLETCGYVAWGPGQPNDDAEHCLAFDSDMTYHDYGCDDLLYFVCEKQPPQSVKQHLTPADDDDDLADETPRGIVIGDYTLFRGIGLYKLHVEAKDWRSAWATCHAEGGHLAVVTSQKEADAIKTLFYFKMTSFTDAFVGAHNLFGHKEFTTIFDSAVNVTSHNGESSASFSGCLTIHRDGQYYTSAWPCSSSMPFVCQIPMK